MSPPGAKPTKERTSLAPKHKAAKMDVARAMGIMGFNSSRWLDASQVIAALSGYIKWDI